MVKRRVFFSFHYQLDIWRANVVRNSWVTQDRAVDSRTGSFFDSSLWEEAEKKGDAEIRRMIDYGLLATSVTAVLVGAETARRPWVRYEIEKSVERGNGILAVRINNIANQAGETTPEGPNPLDEMTVSVNGGRVRLSSLYPLYYWFGAEGWKNFPSWVEAAAKAAGR